MVKLKVIKKVLKYPCYCCRQSIRGDTTPRKSCEVCKGTGYFKDEIYFMIYRDKQGNQYAIDGDTIK